MFPARNSNWRLRAVALVLPTVALLATTAHAGGGPENVFLLVNSGSLSSRTIANHYIRLRRIPDRNVLYLPWSESVERVPVETFREQILKPALAAIQKRSLSDQVDYLIYSSDFPWSIDVRGDVGGRKLPAQLAPTASLTGVTYLWQAVLARRGDAVLNLRNNLYLQSPSPVTRQTWSHGFRSWYGWGPRGRLLEAGGQTYLLSTMLGVTSGRGNTVDEVVHYLRRSARADGTHPSGTIYFMRNGDIRSKTREWAFEDAVAELQALDVRARILEGTLPEKKNDVQGLAVGKASFNWKRSGSSIRPGAICEHLTSAGGILRSGASQTPLSEFLRNGAAGSSGAVTEPYALQEKFPLATMHVHYARGCTLAEAFYQSVAGPFQLIIVGDPLCRPWAVIPTVSLPDLQAGQQVRGVLQLKPVVHVAEGHAVDQLELYVDGRRQARFLPGEGVELDTAQLADGHHELRIVAITGDAIESQGRLIVPLTVANHGPPVRLTRLGDGPIEVGDTIRLKIAAPNARRVVLFQNRRPLEQLSGSEGVVEISADMLGRGPVEIQAVSEGERKTVSTPLRLVIE